MNALQEEALNTTHQESLPDPLQLAPETNSNNQLNLVRAEKKADLTKTKNPKNFDPAQNPERVKYLQERARSIILPIVAIFILGYLWETYSSQEGVVLPGPIKTFKESWYYIAHPFFDNGSNDKGLGWQLFSSLQRVGLGYGLASIIGILMGIIIGKSSIMFKALDPIFQVLRTIPPLAWLPLSLATFGEANPSAIFVIFITAVWPILINTAVGVMRIPSDYENVAQVYQLRGFRYFFLVLLPAASPYIFTGMRISIGMAWLAIVAAEMLTGGVGIGFFIWDSWNSSRMSDIIVSVIYVGLVGLILDRIVSYTAGFFGSKAET